MKVQNKRLRGGPHPILSCACGAQIDPQAKGKKPAMGTMLYCGYECGHYTSLVPRK
jgi:hypothetical protein